MAKPRPKSKPRDASAATVGYEAGSRQQPYARLGLDTFGASGRGGGRLAVATSCACDSDPTGNASLAWVRGIVRLLTPAGLAGAELIGGPMRLKASSGPT